MSDFKPSQPDKEQVSLFLPEAKLEIDNFQEYSFNANFLTPSDGFSFVVGEENLSVDWREALRPGAEVNLRLNGRVQATGYIDSIERSASRGGGVEWRVEGRDRLGQAVDACADPFLMLKESMTLLDGMKVLFGPFGWVTNDQYVEDNDANFQLKVGLTKRRKTRTSDSKGFGRRAIKATQLHQFKAYPREGVFEFASRLTQRHGLWIWASADGRQLIIGAPDFEALPFQQLIRGTNDKGEFQNNVLDGSVKFDVANQPTVIVADGYSQNGEFGRSKVRAIMTNTAVYTNDTAYADTFIRFKDAKNVLGHPFETPTYVPRNRTAFFHDDESQTMEHLENFIRREMALLQRQSLQVQYTVEGHGQITDVGFVPWVVDSTVAVRDEVTGLRETLYVLGVTFNKSRSGGTSTQLELIRLNTLLFTSTGK